MEATHLHVPRGLRFRHGGQARAGGESWATQLRWYAVAAVVGFGVPFVGSSAVGLQHDVYLAVYFGAVTALTAAYARATRLDWHALVRRNWKPGVLLGVLFGFLLVRNVLSETTTAHPGGGYFWFELAWRGLIYGAIDALLLTVLPCTMVHRALGGRLDSWRKRSAYFAASAVLIVAITAIYHLGYRQYREDGVRQPETGNAIISVPMLLTANPIGSVADHAAMHVASVAHIYETEVRLPPPTKAR
jgi:hypothetical protein